VVFDTRVVHGEAGGSVGAVVRAGKGRRCVAERRCALSYASQTTGCQYENG